MVKGSLLEPQGPKTKAFENWLHKKFGFTVSNQVPEGYQGIVKAQLVPKTEPTEFFWYAAPWFMNWYCTSTLIDPEIRSIAHRLFETWITGWGRTIYRGEPAQYQSVRSSLSRHWNTTSVEALRIIKERMRNKANARTGVSESTPEPGLQHLGGQSNFIDFTLNIWTAAYFACQEEDQAAGRIWAFNAQRRREGIEIVQPQPTGIPFADKRIQCQQSVFVESESGELDRNILKLVCTIDQRIKRKILDCLKNIGITTEALFPDLLGMIQDEDETIPISATAHIIMEWIKGSGVERALLTTDSLLDGESSKSPLNKRTYLYLRGIALAAANRPHEARQCLEEAVQLFDGKVPRVLAKNMRLIQLAEKSGDCSRLKRSLDFAVFDNLYQHVLEGYQYVEDD